MAIHWKNRWINLGTFIQDNVLPRWCGGKESACQCRRRKRNGFDLWVRKSPWRRQPAPVFLPGKFHGQRSWGRSQRVRPDQATEHRTQTFNAVLLSNMDNTQKYCDEAKSPASMSRVKRKLLSRVWHFATPWTIWSREFSGPEYRSG